jgi:polar amino acid transport system substrate-binding protein
MDIDRRSQGRKAVMNGTLNRRQIGFLAWAILGPTVFSANASAQVAAARAQLAPTGTLRVVLIPLPNIATRGANGTLAGVPVDLGRELAKRLGVPVDFKAIDNPTDIVDAVKNGDADLTFLVNLPARAAFIEFGPAYVSFGVTYLVPANSPIKSMSDIDQPGHRIIILEKSASEPKLKQLLKQAKLVGIPLGPTQTQMASEMLNRREGDAYSDIYHALALMQSGLPGSRILDGSYMTVEFQIALGKGKPAAAEFVADFIREMKASGFLKEAIQRAGLQGAKVPE